MKKSKFPLLTGLTLKRVQDDFSTDEMKETVRNVKISFSMYPWDSVVELEQVVIVFDHIKRMVLKSSNTVKNEEISWIALHNTNCDNKSFDFYNICYLYRAIQRLHLEVL